MARAKKSDAEIVAEGAVENAAAVKLARRHLASGEISDRKRGRPHPDYELGYVDAAGVFQAGEPLVEKKRKKRVVRPKGSANKKKTSAPAKAKTLAGIDGLGEIEAIVCREVERRLGEAREAAIAAIAKVLS
jgi:hypothetical protein